MLPASQLLCSFAPFPIFEKDWILLIVSWNDICIQQLWLSGEMFKLKR